MCSRSWRSQSSRSARVIRGRSSNAVRAIASSSWPLNDATLPVSGATRHQSTIKTAKMSKEKLRGKCAVQLRGSAQFWINRDRSLVYPRAGPLRQRWTRFLNDRPVGVPHNRPRQQRAAANGLAEPDSRGLRRPNQPQRLAPLGAGHRHDHFQSFNAYVANGIGCTTYSFGVNIGVAQAGSSAVKRAASSDPPVALPAL